MRIFRKLKRSLQSLIILCLMQLLPDCAPYSVAYILELLTLRHCAGCQIYRAESRGQSWDSEGNHIKDVRKFKRFYLFLLWLLLSYDCGVFLHCFLSWSINSVLELCFVSLGVGNFHCIA